MVKSRRQLPQKGRGAAQRVWRRIYLREWREHRDLTGAELAGAAGVSEGLINQIENRKSAGSPETLEKLAKALEIEVGELLDIKPEPDGRIFRVWVHDKDLPRIQAMAEGLSKLKDK